MPAGVSWTRYLTFFSAAMLSAVVGAQVVHVFYNPLADIDDMIEEEKKKLKHK